MGYEVLDAHCIEPNRWRDPPQLTGTPTVRCSSLQIWSFSHISAADCGGALVGSSPDQWARMHVADLQRDLQMITAHDPVCQRMGEGQARLAQQNQACWRGGWRRQMAAWQWFTRCHVPTSAEWQHELHHHQTKLWALQASHRLRQNKNLATLHHVWPRDMTS